VVNAMKIHWEFETQIINANGGKISPGCLVVYVLDLTDFEDDTVDRSVGVVLQQKTLGVRGKPNVRVL